MVSDHSVYHGSVLRSWLSLRRRTLKRYEAILGKFYSLTTLLTKEKTAEAGHAQLQPAPCMK